MPCRRCMAVPPPSATLPWLIMPWPPTSKFSSTTMTDAPRSRARMAAGRPEAPEPTTTTSASRCQVVSCAAAARGARPASAVPPTPAAPLLMNARRPTAARGGFLPMSRLPASDPAASGRAPRGPPIVA